MQIFSKTISGHSFRAIKEVAELYTGDCGEKHQTKAGIEYQTYYLRHFEDVVKILNKSPKEVCIEATNPHDLDTLECILRLD